MRTLAELLERMRGYGDVRYVHDPEVGYVAWRLGTGDNVEILFLERAPGYRGSAGAALMGRMVREIVREGTRPYHSVFAFRLAGNARGERFYRLMGFRQADLGPGLYGGDGAVVMWIPWSDLLERLDAGAEGGR